MPAPREVPHTALPSALTASKTWIDQAQSQKCRYGQDFEYSQSASGLLPGRASPGTAGATSFPWSGQSKKARDLIPLLVAVLLPQA